MTSTTACSFTLRVPQPFELRLAALGHGWYDLPPFEWDAKRSRLAWTCDLGERPVGVRVWKRGHQLAGTCLSAEPLSTDQRRRLRSVVRSCLRLDEDFGAFYEMATADEALAWAARRGAGRLLRSPTAFEDLVKVLCTTNCSWSLTKQMVQRLVDELGEDVPGGGRTFPRAQCIAACDEAFLRERIRCGYRAPHLLELARRVARKELDPEAWRHESTNVEALYGDLIELPGIGPYSAGLLQRLLGHYEHPALDSWCRARFAKLYGARRAKKDASIVRRYRAFGPWLGLALWLDLTREWHENEGVPL